jgi:hypothetical protein
MHPDGAFGQQQPNRSNQTQTDTSRTNRRDSTGVNQDSNQAMQGQGNQQGNRNQQGTQPGGPGIQGQSQPGSQGTNRQPQSGQGSGQLGNMQAGTGNQGMNNLGSTGGNVGSMQTMDASMVRQTIQGWPEAARTAAEAMIAKYGQPHAASTDMIRWDKAGQWHHVTVTREQTPHSFPMPHQDVLEQAVMMKVSPDKIDDISKFDGSIAVKRTEGIVSARCDREEMNIAALNLANDINTGKKTDDQARKQLADVAMQVKSGKTPDLTQKLNFSTSQTAMDTDSQMSTSDMGGGSDAGSSNTNKSSDADKSGTDKSSGNKSNTGTTDRPK